MENVARPEFGFWTSIISFLGFFNVFHSPLFAGAGILFIINIIVCSLNRWKNLRHTFSGSEIKLADDFYAAGGNHAELSSGRLEPSAATVMSSALFKKMHYRVRMETNQGKTYLAADKNRYFIFGSYLGHFSIVLLVLGFLLGAFAGFRNTSFIVAENATEPVGYGTNLSLRLDSFTDEYYPDGMPKDYRSEVVIYQNGQEVKRGIIRVNHPMSYGGVRFHQSFFGTAVTMTVQDMSGKVIYQDNVALSESGADMELPRSTGEFSIPGGYEVYLVGPADSNDPIINSSELVIGLYQLDSTGTTKMVTMDKLEAGVVKQLGDYQFTYSGKAKYSGFQVSRDPGYSLIWIASGLLILGMGLVLYWPHRQVWALIVPSADGGSRLFIRTASAHNIGANLELESMVKSMRLDFSRTED
jgi:cytochrome c biogenesis protein